MPVREGPAGWSVCCHQRSGIEAWSVDAYAALRSLGIERGAKGRLWAPRSPLDDPSSLSLAIAPARSIRAYYGFDSQFFRPLRD